MPNDILKNDPKEEFEKSLVLGIEKLPRDLELFFERHPDIKKEVLGDLEERRIRFENLMRQLEVLRRLEIARIDPAERKLSTLEKSFRRAVAIGDIEEARRIDEQMRQIELESVFNRDLSDYYNVLQIELMKLMRGDDLIEKTEEAVQIGDTLRIPRHQFEMLKNDTGMMQEFVNQLRDEAMNGNSQAVQELKEIQNFFQGQVETELNNALAEDENQGLTENLQIPETPPEREAPQSLGDSLLNNVRDLFLQRKESPQEMANEERRLIQSSTPRGKFIQIIGNQVRSNIEDKLQ